MGRQLVDVIEFAKDSKYKKNLHKIHKGKYNAFKLYFGWDYPKPMAKKNAEELRLEKIKQFNNTPNSAHKRYTSF